MRENNARFLNKRDLSDGLSILQEAGKNRIDGLGKAGIGNLIECFIKMA